MKTRSGIHKIGFEDNGAVSMTQNTPVFGQTFEPVHVAAALGLNESDISDQLPIRIASTALKQMFIPVHEGILEKIEPNYDEIDRISREAGVIGLLIYCLNPSPGVTARCRNFVPTVGIEEDAATGTAAGALTCLLYENGKVSIEDGKSGSIFIQQGFEMGKPSEIKATLKVGNGIEEVRVSGIATTREESWIQL